MHRKKKYLIGLVVRILTNHEDHEQYVGDIEEMYFRKREKQGVFRADIYLIQQLLRSFPLFVVTSIYWGSAMFKNYFTISLRNITRQKGLALINLIGLAVGMTCCLLISMYIISELSFDTFHEKASDIYRAEATLSVGGRVTDLASSNFACAPSIKEAFPEVIETARLRLFSYNTLVEFEEEKIYEDNVFYAEQSVFNIFSIPLIKGDKSKLLNEPYSVVITEKAAEKYFAGREAVGNTLRFNNEYEFKVTGIIADPPVNSHLQYSMLCSFITLRSIMPDVYEAWMMDFQNYTYVHLQSGTDPAVINAKLDELIYDRIGSTLETANVSLNFDFTPLKDIHLYSSKLNDISDNGDIRNIYVFSAIALLILIVASINFINLSTARSITRAKEVGIRKVHGAHRIQLVKQFIGESTIYSFFAALIALGLSVLLLPEFSQVLGREIVLSSSSFLPLGYLFFGLVFCVGLVAGFYPALLLSAFNPALILKKYSKGGKGKSYFRNVLVVIQFTISIGLIGATGIILEQIEFMQGKDPGFNKENVVFFKLMTEESQNSSEVIKSDFLRETSVVNVSASSNVFAHGSRYNAFVPEGFEMSESQLMAAINVDENYLNTVGIEIIEGRGFSKEYPSDPENSVVINETAAKKFNWDEPLGKKIRELDGTGDFKTVIGVVKDFHLRSMHRDIMPLYLENEKRPHEYISVKIAPGKVGEFITILEGKWDGINRDYPFEYHFLDKTVENQYANEERLSELISYFTILAIFIACLGLFGLVAYTAEQRTKEIGIRKVLGASISSLLVMLSKEFIKWVIISNIVAWPLTWYVMETWLQNFAYKTNLGPEVFIYSSLAALVVALVTVLYHALKAAVANPVNSLKYE